MLQEYMVENETLRSENSDLHSVKEKARRDQDQVARENDRLLKKLEDLERYVNSIDMFTNVMYTILAKVAPDNLKLVRGLSDIAKTNVCKVDSKYWNTFVRYTLIK